MTFHITVSTRTALVLLVVAVLAVPATAGATHLFNDVSDSNVHAEGITFMKNSGVSIGCEDGTVYCPDEPVTRAQMGTFMYRLSGNDPATARRSVNAGQLDGLESTDFLRVDAKAADSDLLDGLDSSDLIGPRIFSASVRESGVLEGGNASSATMIGAGVYNVAFPESMAGCSAVGGTGPFGAGSWRNDGVVGIITNGGGGIADNEIQVWIFDDTGGVNVNSDFHVVAVCP